MIDVARYLRRSRHTVKEIVRVFLGKYDGESDAESGYSDKSEKHRLAKLLD